MRFTQNPQLNKELLGRLRAKYLTEKPHPHLTELIYCLTKAYNDLTWPDPLQPTDNELLLFAVGFGLEKMLLYDENSVPPVSVQEDGIWLTLDYIDMQGIGLDLKSTRARNKPDGTPQYGWSDTWMEQFMAYARKQALDAQGYVPNEVHYGVAVVYIIPPDSVVGTFTYTRDEVEANWANLLNRKAVLEQAMRDMTPPEPFKWNKEWECGNCRYKLWCEQATGHKVARR